MRLRCCTDAYSEGTNPVTGIVADNPSVSDFAFSSWLSRTRGPKVGVFAARTRPGPRDAGELCAFGAAPARGPTRWTRHRDHGPAIVCLGFCSFGLFAPRSAGTGGGPRGSGGDASVQARRCKKKTTNRRSEVPTGSAVVLLTKTCVGLVVLRRTDEHCGAR